MTEQEEQIILKELSTRLPYGVKVSCGGKVIDLKVIGDYSNREDHDWEFNELYFAEEIKPYLRSRSHMTKDERDYEIGNFMYDDLLIKQKLIHKYVEWLNSRHIDYNGLIEKGLALEAPDDMYKLKSCS